MADISFLKKVIPPQFSLQLFSGKPSRIIGIDVGTYSTKVVQLRYETGRAILETYGELLNGGYFKTAGTSGSGFLRYNDEEIANVLKDVATESKITARDAIFAVPAAASFITTIALPRVDASELAEAIPFEARKYIPIPLAEVVLDWDIVQDEENEKLIKVLLVAVPRETIEKYRRIADLAKLRVRSLEIESFSAVRSLVRPDPTPTAIVNLGNQTTTLTVADRGMLVGSYSVGGGAEQLTLMLERGLAVTHERAETIKRDVGLSEKIEEQEIVSIMTPFLETTFNELERLIAVYNRKAPRHIQKVILAGGGANLKGIVDFAASHFGVEVTRATPFGKVVTPAFIQPILREIGPSFATAIGCGLHEIAPR